ncbi:MAG: glutamyl-tRNA reductase, partial [Pirellulales bacterium]
MKLQMIGCSHHNSSLAVRERVAFTPEESARALVQLRQRYPRVESVLLSTCNRTEIYTAADEETSGPSHEEIAQFVADFHRLPIYEIFDDLFARTGEDAVRHLFTVAASLDSMVVG